MAEGFYVNSGWELNSKDVMEIKTVFDFGDIYKGFNSWTLLRLVVELIEYFDTVLI